MSTESADANRTVVAIRGALPDLSVVVRRLQRRRLRRPAGHRRASRPSAVARRRRDLAEPDHAVAQRRLGLRRRRLLRGAAGDGNARAFDALVAAAHARGIRVAARLRPEPHQRSSTRGSSTPARRGPRRIATGTCGPIPSPTARRRTTGSAASVARPGRSTRRPASTTCTTTFASNPTSTGGTTRCATPSTASCASGSTAASTASGSTCAT